MVCFFPEPGHGLVEPGEVGELLCEHRGQGDTAQSGAEAAHPHWHPPAVQGAHLEGVGSLALIIHGFFVVICWCF